MTVTDIGMFVRTNIASYLKIPVEDAAPSRALEALGMDSMGALELILTCEEEFGFGIDMDTDEAEIVTVADAIAYIERRIAAGSGAFP
jgi:acyl carrier protein